MADNIDRHIVFAPISRYDGVPVINNEDDGDITDFGDQLYEEDQKPKGPRSTTPFPLNNTNKSLQDELFSAIHPTHTEKKGFFPKGLLSDMLTEECVHNELCKHLQHLHGEKVIREYAKKICAKTEILCSGSEDDSKRKIRCFRKLFAILVLIEKTASIVKFMEEREDV